MNTIALPQNTEQLKSQLGALIYRFISENIADYCNNLMTEAGVPSPDYTSMPDHMAEKEEAHFCHCVTTAQIVEREQQLRADIDAIVKELDTK